MNKKSIILSLCILLILTGRVFAYWEFSPLPSPELYGNILINRLSTTAGLNSVTFSHWSHRSKYTCNVCHSELDFNMMLNSTMITEEANKQGRYCGACHDDKLAFGHTKEHCDKCHNGNIGFGREKFEKLKGFPSAPFGNKIDWTQAWKDGLIEPLSYLRERGKPIKFAKELTLEATWSMIPPAEFSHKEHMIWLDCSNCHPEIFNIKKKTTRLFSMLYILQNEFCGVCHGKVAFPVQSCTRCHPKMKR